MPRPLGYEAVGSVIGFLRGIFQNEAKERFGEVEQPWDFWGNVMRFWGSKGGEGGPSRFKMPQRGLYTNPQWGEENIKMVKEILEE